MHILGHHYCRMARGSNAANRVLGLWGSLQDLRGSLEYSILCSSQSSAHSAGSCLAACTRWPLTATLALPLRFLMDTAASTMRHSNLL